MFETNAKYYNYKTLVNHLKRSYAIDEPTSDVVELALTALKEVGNTGVINYLLTEIVDYTIPMPCDCEHIIALGILGNNTLLPPASPVLFYNTSLVFNQFGRWEATEPGTQMGYPRFEKKVIVKRTDYSRFVDYKVMPNSSVIETNVTNIPVCLEYLSMAVDEDGYPMIMDKAFEFVTAFIAETFYRIKFLQGTTDGQRLQYLQAKVNETKAAARRYVFNRNENDEMLNIQHSLDRGRYNQTMR